jgi:sensor histidine kinase YesM
MAVAEVQSRILSVWRSARVPLLTNTAIALGLLVLNFLFDPRSTGREWLQYLTFFLVFSHVIGGLASLTIPRLAMRIWGWPAPRMWPVYVAGLVTVAVVGTLLAMSILWVLGVVSSEFFMKRLASSIQISTVITLIVGVASYVIESTRGRLEHTTVELKQQQLERERAQKLAAEARFSSLQSRLQPHFLFNTINSVTSLIREDPRAAEEMLLRLSRLLRYALDSQQRGQVSLGEELKLVGDYLEIERTRFGARLRFQIDVGQEALACEIPPYAVQTLVENSMKYVVSQRREGGRIEVKARREGGYLELEVRDDGAGFTRDDLGDGHGLDTLEKRMLLLYGESASLEIERGAGCVVRLRIPAGVAA